MEHYYQLGKSLTGVYVKISEKQLDDLEIIRRPFSSYQTPSNLNNQFSKNNLEIKDISFSKIEAL